MLTESSWKESWSRKHSRTLWTTKTCFVGSSRPEQFVEMMRKFCDRSQKYFSLHLGKIQVCCSFQEISLRGDWQVPRNNLGSEICLEAHVSLPPQPSPISGSNLFGRFLKAFHVVFLNIEQLISNSRFSMRSETGLMRFSHVMHFSKAPKAQMSHIHMLVLNFFISPFEGKT